MDKLTLLFASVERLAIKVGDRDLVDYLSHSSHHSGEFIEAVNSHHSNLGDFGAFVTRHEEATHPVSSGVVSYSKAEVDAMIMAAIRAAKTSDKAAKPVKGSE